MTNYSVLGRKMNSELRLSYRKLLTIVVLLMILFVYILNKSSCESQENYDQILDQIEEPSAVIYAITPTYYRPVQKAELTR